MNRTSIEWTDFTWNPIRARHKDTGKVGTFCTRISPGCQHCYASTINMRFGNRLEYTVPNLENVEFFIDEKILEEPLKRKQPAKIFVGDMFDLFHEAIPDEHVIRVFEVMQICKWHIFQLLTKRPAAMNDFFACCWGECEGDDHIWLGTSVESPDYLYRIDLLCEAGDPAAIHFLSIEPLLEDLGVIDLSGIDLVIVGGESGPGARPFYLHWADNLRRQCKAAGAAFFMKQIGSKPMLGCMPWKQKLLDRKGGNPEDFPQWLRVREFPKRGRHGRKAS